MKFQMKKLNSMSLAFLFMVTTASSVVYGMEEDLQHRNAPLTRQETRDYVKQSIIPRFGGKAEGSYLAFSQHNLSKLQIDNFAKRVDDYYEKSVRLGEGRKREDIFFRAHLIPQNFTLDAELYIDEPNSDADKVGKLLRSQDFFPRDQRTFRECLSKFSKQKTDDGFKNTLHALADIFSHIEEGYMRGAVLQEGLSRLIEVSENEVRLAKHLITPKSAPDDIISILWFIKQLKQDDALASAIKVAGRFNFIDPQQCRDRFINQRNIINSLKELKDKAISLDMKSTDILMLFKNCGFFSEKGTIAFDLLRINNLGSAIKQAWRFNLLDQKTDKPDSSQGPKFLLNEDPFLLESQKERLAKDHIIEFLEELDKLDLKEDRIKFAQIHSLINISTSWTQDLYILKSLPKFKEETLKVGAKFSLVSNPVTALSYLLEVDQDPQAADKILQEDRVNIDINEFPHVTIFWKLMMDQRQK